METNSLAEFHYDSLSIYYRKGTEDDKVLSHSFDNDIFFREIPSFKPGKAPVIVDVGAHIGTFSILSSIKFPQGKVFSIEASRQTFEILKENILRNQLPIKAYHNALLDRTGAVKLFHNAISGNWGHSVTKEFSDQYEEVQAMSLEDFVLMNGIEFIDLVKLNCEGAEFNILLNAPQTVVRKIGLAIILYHEDLAVNGYCLDDLQGMFEENSFRTLAVRKSEKRGWLIVWNKRIYSNLYFLYSAITRRIKK